MPLHKLVVKPSAFFWWHTALFNLLFLSFASSVFSQRSNIYTAKVTRILFVLDASGSMKGSWEGTSKFDLSKQILTHSIDSISKANTRVEFALRVMGHQFARSASNCTDTKLEVPFERNNISKIEQRLTEVKAQGQTPIAFTLGESVADFPVDSMATNAIIIITDGNETCGGNICESAGQMQAKGIILKPFIVGLGLPDSLKKKFECAGFFYDVQNEEAFKNVMNVVISKALNPTTAQINLLDAFSKPTETNVEMTLYEHGTNSIAYNFIHTLNTKGNPDTLVIDPRKSYDIVVHTFPPVAKNGVELVPGIHNTIALDVPRGSLELKIEGISPGYSNIPCIIREQGKKEILYVQDFNTTRKYLTGTYDLEILSLPSILMKGVVIEQGKIIPVTIPRAGTLTVNLSEPGVASVFQNNGEALVKIYDYYKLTSGKSLSLQPGKYIVIYRPDKGKQSARTKQFSVQITSGKTSTIRL